MMRFDDDMLLFAEKSMENSIHVRKANTSVFENPGEKPKIALEELEREILNASPQPSTSTFHTQVPPVQKATTVQGFKKLNDQVVCPNVSAGKIDVPSHDTNTGINMEESSHGCENGTFAKGLAPPPE